jgi:hypothetical protein
MSDNVRTSPLMSENYHSRTSIDWHSRNLLAIFAGNVGTIADSASTRPTLESISRSNYLAGR